MVRLPPVISTLTGDCARLVAIAATALAQAPVPQASVSPAPRSNVRNFRRLSITSCDVDVDPLGKSWVVLDPWAELVERHLARIGNEENDVGIADIEAIGCSKPSQAIGSAAVSIG